MAHRYSKNAGTPASQQMCSWVTTQTHTCISQSDEYSNPNLEPHVKELLRQYSRDRAAVKFKYREEYGKGAPEVDIDTADLWDHVYEVDLKERTVFVLFISHACNHRDLSHSRTGSIKAQCARPLRGQE